MMSKTVKKSKRDGSGKRLSYVVTESGLVENDESCESSDQKRTRTSNARSLLGSITEIDDAKNKFKGLAERRKSLRISDDAEAEAKRKFSLTKSKDPKAALAEINAAEAERRRSSITIADIAETKRRMSIVPKRKGKKSDGGESDKNTEQNENEIGLIECDAMKKRIQQIGAALLMTKALATMSGPRRQRKQLMKSVLSVIHPLSLQS